MKKIILLLGVIIPTVSNASFYPKDMFMDDIQRNKKCEVSETKCDYSALFRYTFYIAGIADALIDAKYICPSSGVSGRQVEAIVNKYLKNNPEEWSKSSNYLVETPLLKAFPCKKN